MKERLIELIKNTKAAFDQMEDAMVSETEFMSDFLLANGVIVPPCKVGFHVIDNKTGKEADPCEIANDEEWADSLIYCDLEGFALLENGSLVLLDECGNYEYCPEGRFDVVFDEEG